MKKAFLGFTFLLAAFFPVGGQLLQMLAGSMLRSSFKGGPSIAFYILTLIATFLPPALITLWFFKSARLAERTPVPTPGATLMTIGVLLTLCHIIAALFASTVEGGGASFVVSQLAPLVVWPARILLVIGAVRFLLAAEPSNHSFNGDVVRATRR